MAKTLLFGFIITILLAKSFGDDIYVVYSNPHGVLSRPLNSIGGEFAGNLVFKRTLSSAIHWRMAGDKLEQDEFCLFRFTEPSNHKIFLNGQPNHYHKMPVSCPLYLLAPQFDEVDLIYQNKQVTDKLSSRCLKAEATAEKDVYEARFIQCTNTKGELELLRLGILGKDGKYRDEL